MVHCGACSTCFPLCTPPPPAGVLRWTLKVKVLLPPLNWYSEVDSL